MVADNNDNDDKECGGGGGEGGRRKDILLRVEVALGSSGVKFSGKSHTLSNHF